MYFFNIDPCSRQQSGTGILNFFSRWHYFSVVLKLRESIAISDATPTQMGMVMAEINTMFDESNGKVVTKFRYSVQYTGDMTIITSHYVDDD